MSGGIAFQVVPAPKTAPAAPRRKKLPRTFNRRPALWMQAILELPEVSDERIFRLRHDVLDLSRADAARLLRVARNTVWDWEAGRRTAPFAALLALHLIAERRSESQHTLPHAAPIEYQNRPQDSTSLVQLTAPEIEPAPDVGRIGRRARAARLRQRMAVFSDIYNSGWHIRNSWGATSLRRQELAWEFAKVLARELQRRRDYEALIYAVADALTCSPHGVPWE